MPHWAARTPLWVLGAAAVVGFVLLAGLIIRGKGLRDGLDQVSLWTASGAAGFAGAAIKYSLRESLLLLAFVYPMLVVASGFQPHRLMDMDELTRGSDEAATRQARRFIWRFIAIVIVEVTIVFFLLGQPGVGEAVSDGHRNDGRF